MFDQFDDREFEMLRDLIKDVTMKRLAVSDPGVIMGKGINFPEGFGFIRQITSPLRNVVPFLQEPDPDLAALFGTELDEGNFFEDIKSKAYRGMLPLIREAGSPQRVRIILKKIYPCGDNATGRFPLHNPLHQLLSLIYATAQSAEPEVMNIIQNTASNTFGPKTVKEILANVYGKPEEMIRGLPDRTAPSIEAPPAVATFMPELIHDLIKLNLELKGKIDHLQKLAVDKFRKGTYLTINDRAFQQTIMDGLSAVPADIVQNLLLKPTVKVVYNSAMDASLPEIIKVNGFLVDLGKVNNMGYGQACVSLSQQVADYIYDSAKQNVVPEQFIEMIERLSSLKDIPPEDRKELDDRVIGPIRNFFEPDDVTVDKLMGSSKCGRG